MADHADQVHAAIDRWVGAGVIDVALSKRLKSEVRDHAAASTTRLSQYVLAFTGGVLLLFAGGVFLSWAWPYLGVEGQSVVLAVAGFAVIVGGVRLEAEERWRPASYLMQASGLGLLLAAYIHSESVWPDQSIPGFVVGIASLVTPIALTAHAMRRSVVMPAIHLAAGLAFLAIFLDRTTGMSFDEIVWCLDAVLVAAIVVLVRMLQSDPDLRQRPWALNAFVLAMGAGFVFVALTALGPFSMSEDALIPVDLWLAFSVALTLWGVHRAPAGLRRSWFQTLLAWEMLAWAILGCITVGATWNADPWLALILVGGVAVVGFMHADKHSFDALMTASSFAFIVPVWWWSVDTAGALGGVFALLATAGLLFWASGRRDRPEVGEA
ncbi:MAG: hypothetical protein AAF389_01325 [Gemmatimonadota bacterium]